MLKVSPYSLDSHDSTRLLEQHLVDSSKVTSANLTSIHQILSTEVIFLLTQSQSSSALNLAVHQELLRGRLVTCGRELEVEVCSLLTQVGLTKADLEAGPLVLLHGRGERIRNHASTRRGKLETSRSWSGAGRVSVR